MMNCSNSYVTKNEEIEEESIEEIALFRYLFFFLTMQNYFTFKRAFLKLIKCTKSFSVDILSLFESEQ